MLILAHLPVWQKWRKSLLRIIYRQQYFSNTVKVTVQEEAGKNWFSKKKIPGNFSWMINSVSQNSSNRCLLMTRGMEMPNRKVKGILTLESRAGPGDRGTEGSPARRGRTHRSCWSSSISVIINVRGHLDLLGVSND